MEPEYYALICNGRYVEMHDTYRVGRPLHRRVVPSCVTTDMTYAVYLREELRQRDGLESQIVQVDPPAS